MAEDFQQRPDTYEPILPIWTRMTALYRDGERVYGEEDAEPAQEPGWTVQGARRGQAA